MNVSEGFNSFQFKDYLMSYYQIPPYSFILEVDIYRKLGFKRYGTLRQCHTHCGTID